MVKKRNAVSKSFHNKFYVTN